MLRLSVLCLLTLINYIVHTVRLVPEFGTGPGIIMSLYSVFFTGGMVVLAYKADYNNRLLFRFLLAGFVIGTVMWAYNPVISIIAFGLYFTQRFEYETAEWLMAQDGYPDFVYEADIPEQEDPKPMKLHFGRNARLSMEGISSDISEVPPKIEKMPGIPDIADEASHDLITVAVPEKEDVPEQTEEIQVIPDIADETSHDLITVAVPEVEDAPEQTEKAQVMPDIADETSHDLTVGSGSGQEKLPEETTQQHENAPSAESPLEDPEAQPFPEVASFGKDVPLTTDFPDIAGDIQELPEVPDLPDIPDIPVL